MSAVGIQTYFISTVIMPCPRHLDVLKVTFLNANKEIEDAVNNGNFSDFHDTFFYLNTLSTSAFNRYIAEDSYYPALTSAMQKRQFKKVLDALEALKEYPKFETPTILFCKAACLLQLNRKPECSAILEKQLDYNLLVTMINSAKDEEKSAYERLFMFR